MTSGKIPTVAYLKNYMYFSDILLTLLYGVYICAAAQSVYFLLLGQKSTRRKTFYISFTTVLSTAFTIVITGQYVRSRHSWLQTSDDVGAPILVEGYNAYVGAPVELAAIAPLYLCSFLADGLLMYRCFNIWASNRLIIIIPTLLLLASAGLSIAVITFSVLGKGTLDPKVSGPFHLMELIACQAALAIVNAVFTTLITFFIVLRLWYMQYSILEIDSALPLGSMRMVRRASAMLVESAVPYAASGIWYAAANWPKVEGDSLTAFLAGGLYTGFVFVSPQLIILRVSMNFGNGKLPASRPSMVEFMNRSLDLEALGEGFKDSDSATTSSQILPPYGSAPLNGQEKRSSNDRIAHTSTY